MRFSEPITTILHSPDNGGGGGGGGNDGGSGTFGPHFDEFNNYFKNIARIYSEAEKRSIEDPLKLFGKDPVSIRKELIALNVTQGPLKKEVIEYLEEVYAESILLESLKNINSAAEQLRDLFVDLENELHNPSGNNQKIGVIKNFLNKKRSEYRDYKNKIEIINQKYTPEYDKTKCLDLHQKLYTIVLERKKIPNFQQNLNSLKTYAEKGQYCNYAETLAFIINQLGRQSINTSSVGNIVQQLLDKAEQIRKKDPTIIKEMSKFKREKEQISIAYKMFFQTKMGVDDPFENEILEGDNFVRKTQEILTRDIQNFNNMSRILESILKNKKYKDLDIRASKMHRREIGNNQNLTDYIIDGDIASNGPRRVLLQTLFRPNEYIYNGRKSEARFKVNFVTNEGLEISSFRVDSTSRGLELDLNFPTIQFYQTTNNSQTLTYHHKLDYQQRFQDRIKKIIPKIAGMDPSTITMNPILLENHLQNIITFFQGTQLDLNPNNQSSVQNSPDFASIIDIIMKNFNLHTDTSRAEQLVSKV